MIYRCWTVYHLC